jgi:hypothetical protein
MDAGRRKNIAEPQSRSCVTRHFEEHAHAGKPALILNDRIRVGRAPNARRRIDDAEDAARGKILAWKEILT